MKQRHTKPDGAAVKENPRATAIKRILNIAQLVRQRGAPEQAEEALKWEVQLQRRLEEIEKAPEAQAA